MDLSKKYLIHCIAWNVIGFSVLMSMGWGVVSDILGDFTIFLLWAVTVISFPLVLLIVGVYLLWRGAQRRKLIVVGMVISTLFLFFELWTIDGLFVPNLSSQIFCTEDTQIPPRYLCPQ